jgi:hypothetical protein
MGEVIEFRSYSLPENLKKVVLSSSSICLPSSNASKIDELVHVPREFRGAIDDDDLFNYSLAPIFPTTRISMNIASSPSKLLDLILSSSTFPSSIFVGERIESSTSFPFNLQQEMISYLLLLSLCFFLLIVFWRFLQRSSRRTCL